MYNGTRDAGLGVEVKRRVLMGTYALSAGYYDAYYKRAQQARPPRGGPAAGGRAIPHLLCADAHRAWRAS